MKISRSKKKLDQHTQQTGLSETNYHVYNTHFWRFEANVFQENMVRSNHILKDLAKCREDHDILDMSCTLIHTEYEWTTVTRLKQQKKGEQLPPQPVDNLGLNDGRK